MGDRDDAIVDIDPPGRSAPDDDGGTYISEFDQRNNVFLAGEPTWRDTLTDKGNISNMISLALFIVGIVVVAIWPDSTSVGLPHTMTVSRERETGSSNSHDGPIACYPLVSWRHTCVSLISNTTTTVTPLQFVLSFGLYGFCAGFTNSIAIWMLFDKIPGLYGSGIIVEQYVTSTCHCAYPMHSIARLTR